MTQLQQKLSLPTAMADKLNRVRRRTLRVHIGTALVAAVGVLLAAMAIAMVVDWLATLYEFHWRALLTYSAWGAAGITLLAWTFAAWRHTQRVEQVAAKVDREVPELEERWSTVTEVTSNGQSTEVHPAMFKQVTTEAQSWTPRIEADRVVPLDGLIRALLFLTAITTVLGIAVIFDSQRTTVLLRRFWQPYTAISATEFTDVTDQQVIGRGESLEIGASLIGATVKEASLLLEPQDGEPKTITLIPRGEGKDRLTHRLRAVKEPLRYRLRAGDGQTPWYEIVVADRPQLAQVKLKLTPPAYARKETKTINKLPRRVTVLEGSHVEIALKPKQKLKSLRLKLGPDLTEQLQVDKQGWYRWESTVTQNLSFQPLLTEEHGLDNLRPPTCEIRVRPDKPPVVKILTPNSEMAVRPDETIPVTFVASDDVGVHFAELVVYDEGQKNDDGTPTVLDRIPIDLGEQQGAVKVKATVDLDLSQYATTDGSELSFSIRVREDRGQMLLKNLASNNGSPTLQSREATQAAANQPSNQTDTSAGNSEASTQPEQVAATMSDSASATTSESTDQQADGQNAGEQLAMRNPPASAENTATSSTPSNATVAAISDKAMSDEVMPDQAKANERTSQGDAQSGNNASTQSQSNSSASRQASSGNPSDGNNAPTNSSANSQTTESSQVARSNKSAGSNTDQSPTGEADSVPTSPTENPDEKGRTASSGRQSLNTSDPSKPDDRPNTTEDEQASDSSGSDSLAPSDTQSNNNSGATSPSSSNQNNSQQGSPSEPSDPSQSAREDMTNNASNQSSRDSSNSNASDQQQNPSDSSRPPGANMTQRNLDVESAQSSNSQRMRLKIDEWAGSYDGQQRQQLEIAIQPMLDELDRALEKAELLSRAVLDEADAGEAWASKHDRDLQKADKQIEAAIKVVERLETKTYDTPYAFIGLQLVDISQAHIGPARRDFWKSMQTDDTVRVESVRSGWQHTVRARELMVLLTERYERTKAEYKVAESIEKIKKMYMLYVENSMQLLRAGGEGSRYSRKTYEYDLDEETLKEIERMANLRNEMRAELARILADDPRLLRRFLDVQNNRSKILRNELDRLIERQEDLNRETRAWANVEDEKRPKLAGILLGRHVESAQDLAIAAADLHDRFETWSPLGKEVEDTEFRQAAELLQKIATSTQELSADGASYVAEQLKAKKAEDVAEAEEKLAEATEKILVDAQQLYDNFTKLEVSLRRIGSRPDGDEVSFFATNRLIETRRLVEQTSAWIRQLKQQQSGNYHRSAEVAQYRLAIETDSLASKLADLEQSMANLLQRDDGQVPQSIAEKSRGLLAALDEQAAPNQLAAVYALRRNRMSKATKNQETAHEGLELAAKLYDEMIEASIIELDKLPLQDPFANEPTLDDLLRQLEQEVPMQELLGVPARPTNLRIMTDWLRNGGDNAANTGASRRMMMNQMRRQQRMRDRRLDKARRDAIARALREADAEDLVKNMPKLARETTDWNRLASQLEDDLRQGRDKAPPERYRRAIKQYFEQVSGSGKETD